jgi:hypothetical protein
VAEQLARYVRLPGIVLRSTRGRVSGGIRAAQRAMVGEFAAVLPRAAGRAAIVDRSNSPGGQEGFGEAGRLNLNAVPYLPCC